MTANGAVVTGPWHIVIVCIAVLIGLCAFEGGTAGIAYAQDVPADAKPDEQRTPAEGNAETGNIQKDGPLKAETGKTHSSQEAKKKAKHKLSTGEEILLTEGMILLYSSVSLIEHGAGVMGGFIILSSPLAFNNNAITTWEEPIVTFAGFIAVGSYNIYMERRDLPRKDMFRNNLIAMNALALSITAAHFYGHPYGAPSKQEKAGFGLFADATGVYGALNLRW